ncbi:FUSC family protein [Xenophilus sp. Marseille-Q4582]|uniref:FUSC family protein n=1 Tax=Xenophilus sp. Marseille-Q4582 TaxID=2866600 RepID=UPI001CE497AA|nr:FUSC family protein [Xenophilus sp. Marseille-Q4582]
MATPAAEAAAQTARGAGAGAVAAPAGAADWRALPGLLAPAPGRFEFALRLALVCTASAGVAAWYGTPEPALTAYVGFFLLRADRTTSCILSLGLLLLASLLIGAVALMANGLIGRPAALLASMTVIAFGLLFLASASKLAPVGGILALVVTFALSLIALVPEGELATRALLYAWLMVAIPVGVSLTVNLLAGPAPRRLAERALARRLHAAAALLREGDARSRQALRELRAEGPHEIQTWLRLAALERSSAGRDIDALRQASGATVRVLLLADLLDGTLRDPQARQALAETLEGMAAILRAGGYPVDVTLPPEVRAADAPADQALAALRHTLAHFADAAPPPADPDPRPGFFAPDAFSQPAHVRFALKATGAAMACYLFYNAIGWQGIHTAFITCFIVALATTGETVQKLTLRIAGCLLGAAAGVIALLFVLPQVQGLAGLLALLFVVSLGATWVAAGSPRIAYAGFQIAFAFYLCVLQGSGPSYDLAVARDRVIGILVGNAVVYLVFTRVWPVSVAPRIAAARTALLQRLARLADASDPRLADLHAGRAESERGALAADLALLRYEPPRLRPAPSWIAAQRQMLQHTEALLPPLALHGPDPALARTLEALARPATEDAAPALPPHLAPWLARPLQALAHTPVGRDPDASHHASS